MANNFFVKKDHLEYYRSQHTTLGCRITHLFGIPMIFLSVPSLLLNWKLAAFLFIFGWILQFIGHYVFEKNSPILASKHGSIQTIFAALIFAGQHWFDTFKSLKKHILSSKQKQELDNHSG